MHRSIPHPIKPVTNQTLDRDVFKMAHATIDTSHCSVRQPLTPKEAPMQQQQDKPPFHYLPDSEAGLLCNVRRRLFDAFKQAGVRDVAEWLFAKPAHAFHHGIPLPSSAFTHAIALKGSKKIETCSTPMPNDMADMSPKDVSTVWAGHDLLLVPVRILHGRVVGYTFGGLATPEEVDPNCALGTIDNMFIAHTVGRFTYDARLRDLLIVAHGLTKGVSGIMHLRGGDDALAKRERSWFLVHGGDHGFRRLPGRVLVMITATETRVQSMLSKFQFSAAEGLETVSGGVGANDMSLRQPMGMLERLAKGTFVSDRFRKDDLDDETGEVVGRMTGKMELNCDAMDPIGMQVFKDLAVRMYYLYMSQLVQSKDAQNR